MGHTACLWQGNKLIIFGGENEHREYLQDVVIFDIQTASWTQPDVRGVKPLGRARHAAVIHEDKMFVCGGSTGPEASITLDDICYLDLKTWTWSRTWTYVARFDHSVWVWGDRIWLYGGIGPDLRRSCELFWLDLKSNPTFRSAGDSSESDIFAGAPRSRNTASAAHGRAVDLRNMDVSQIPVPPPAVSVTGYTANSSSVQVRNVTSPQRPVAPGTISSVKFRSGSEVPPPASGTHFYAYSSGTILDFVTLSGTIRPSECHLAALELNSFRWQRLAEGSEIFDPGYRWQYCTLNEDGTKAWLLGCTNDNPEAGTGTVEEWLSELVTIDLKKYGLLGDDPMMMPAKGPLGFGKMPASDANANSDLSGPSADLAKMFDLPASSDDSSDFTVTADPDSYSSGSPTPEPDDRSSSTTDAPVVERLSHTSPPIRVHYLILWARWPHFQRMYQAQMSEFHTRKLHIPEPYPVVRAFLYYLYTDSIAKHPFYCPSLSEVAGMLVLSNMYDMPRLRCLCLHRLSRELDVESAATVWERAGVAGEDWLKARAARFAMCYWGRIVRTESFRRLSRECMVELCEVVDLEGRVVGGEELEIVGGLGGGRFGFGGAGRNGTRSTRGSIPSISESDSEENADDGMDMG